MLPEIRVKMDTHFYLATGPAKYIVGGGDGNSSDLSADALLVIYQYDYNHICLFRRLQIRFVILFATSCICNWVARLLFPCFSRSGDRTSTLFFFAPYIGALFYQSNP